MRQLFREIHPLLSLDEPVGERRGKRGKGKRELNFWTANTSYKVNGHGCSLVVLQMVVSVSVTNCKWHMRDMDGHKVTLRVGAIVVVHFRFPLCSVFRSVLSLSLRVPYAMRLLLFELSCMCDFFALCLCVCLIV